MNEEVITTTKAKTRKRRSRQLTAEELAEIKRLITEEKRPLLYALKIVGMPYHIWMNVDPVIKDEIRDLLGKSPLHSDRSGEPTTIEKILAVQLPEPVYTRPEKVEDVVVPDKLPVDNDIIKAQFIAIMNCIANKEQFKHQLKERLKRLVERNYFTSHQAGQIEYCFTAVLLIYHK